MTEKELRRLWWWRDNEAWLKIADKLGGHFPCKTIKIRVIEICKIEYERAAFNYEVQARGSKPETVAYPLGKAFPDLSGKDIFEWRKRFLSQAWRNAGAIGSRSPGVKLSPGEITLDGIIVTPGKTTPGLFQKGILELVEHLMQKNQPRAKKLGWGKEEYHRKKPWPWHTLENVDRMANRIKLVKVKGETEPEQSARRLLRDYKA